MTTLTKTQAFDIHAAASLTNNSEFDVVKANKELSQGILSFITLQIVLGGKLQEIEHIRKAFAKGGQYHSLRMIKSRAEYVALKLSENSSFSYETKDGVIVCEKSTVLNWDSETALNGDKLSCNAPSFNVSSAYKAMKALEVAPAPNQENAAIEAFLEQSGMSKADFTKMAAINPDFATEAKNQGLTILAAQAMEKAQNDIPALVAKIQQDLATLQAIDPTNALFAQVNFAQAA